MKLLLIGPYCYLTFLLERSDGDGKLPIERNNTGKCHHNVLFWAKGIGSQDFRWLQMILVDRIGLPDVPLKVDFVLNFHFHIVI